MNTAQIPRRWKPEEIVNQIRLTRKQAGTAGHAHWNMKALMRNPALDSALERAVYSEPAILPAASWLDRAAPAKPQLAINSPNGSLKLSWTQGGEPISTFILQTRSGEKWTTTLLPGSEVSYTHESPPQLLWP